MKFFTLSKLHSTRPETRTLPFSFRDYKDWLDAYKKRSVAVRAIYKKNTEMVNCMVSEFSLKERNQTFGFQEINRILKLNGQEI